MTFTPRKCEFVPTNPVITARAARGHMSYHAGLAAEATVAADYVARGYRLIAERWRGKRGEIDLIFADGDGVILVEVKQSRDVETAMSHVTPAKVRRLFRTGEEYLGSCRNGSLTDVRFDLALVDGRGQVTVMENAFSGWM